MANIVSAVFDDRKKAEDAADALRNVGVPDDAISVIARDSHASEAAADAGKGTAAGFGIGAGAGAILGVAAAFIPGVGPFLAGGAIAASLGLVGASAATGAVVGGISGGIAGALSHWGLNEADARYYAGEVERGGTWVGVDLARTNATRQLITEIFGRYDGRTFQTRNTFDPTNTTAYADEEMIDEEPVATTRSY